VDIRTIRMALYSLLAVTVGLPVAQYAWSAASARPARASAPAAAVAAASPAAHAPSAVASAPPAPRVPALDPAALHPGARLQGRYGSQWRRVTVLHVLAQRAYIHFEGCSDAWNRWATVADLRPRDQASPALPPLAAPGSGALEGVWLEPLNWPQAIPGSGMMPYVFRGDGTVVRGRLAAGSVAMDFAAMQREDPACAGTYRIEGERVQIQWADRGMRTLNLGRGAASAELAGLVRVPVYTASARLDGRFTPLRAGGADRPPDRVFRADGTVTRERAFEAGGAPDRGSTAGYALGGNVLTLRTPRGDVHELIYPLQGDAPNARLVTIGGTVYRLVEESID
jgi:hypothetical protein